MQRERPARDELDARRVDRDGDAVGVVLVARLQRMDAAQVDPVGEHAAGRDLLRARDDDAVVALLHHAGVERRIALLVRGLAAVDLRRHDRIAEVEMLVAHLLVESDDVVGEFLPARREHARHRRVAGEEARDMIGRAAHQAERRLRPGLGEQPPRAQVGVRSGNLVGAQHRRAGLGRDEGHALAHLGRGRDVVEPRHRARGLAEGRMLGDVGDLLAVDEDLPSVIERAQVFGPGPQRCGGGTLRMQLLQRRHW